MRLPDLPELHTVKSKGKLYHYAYRGGPRLPDPRLDKLAFIEAYGRAIRKRDAPRNAGQKSVGDLLLEYQRSAEFRRLAKSTQREYSRALITLREHFGDLAVDGLDAPRMPLQIREFRDERSATPRWADYCVEVASSAFGWAMRYGKITTNPAKGIESIHYADRSEIIWEEDELEKLLAAATPECARALKVSAWTGLRLGDLIQLRRAEIDWEAGLIERGTNKSKRRTRAFVPLLDPVREALESAPKINEFALNSGLGKPWTQSGLGNAFRNARDAIGVRKKLHDLRGTACTRMALAGFDHEAIAGFMGWEVEHVKKIIRRYLGARAAALAAIERMKK